MAHLIQTVAQADSKMPVHTDSVTKQSLRAQISSLRMRETLYPPFSRCWVSPPYSLRARNGHYGCSVHRPLVSLRRLGAATSISAGAGSNGIHTRLGPAPRRAADRVRMHEQVKSESKMWKLKMGWMWLSRRYKVEGAKTIFESIFSMHCHRNNVKFSPKLGGQLPCTTAHAPPPSRGWKIERQRWARVNLKELNYWRSI